MNKKIAKQIADDKIKEVLSGNKSRTINILSESEHEFIIRNGIEYQIRVNAFYDDKEKKTIRICAAVDDQKFWSTLFPISRSELIRSELITG